MRANHREPQTSSAAATAATPSKRKQPRAPRKVLPVLHPPPQQQQQLTPQHQQQLQQQHQELPLGLSANSVTMAMAAGHAAFPVRSLVVANVAAMGLAATPLLGNGL
ncbi:unnamed protein product [Ixodes persulcatus]